MFVSMKSREGLGTWLQLAVSTSIRIYQYFYITYGALCEILKNTGNVCKILKNGNIYTER